MNNEQKWNIRGTDINRRESSMTNLVQDVVSLVSVSAFIVTMAMWIGAL
ncbi:hypothetical protein [Mesorhizobium sp. 1B3]